MLLLNSFHPLKSKNVIAILFNKNILKAEIKICENHVKVTKLKRYFVFQLSPGANDTNNVLFSVVYVTQ
jgi:hypothetical protein